MAELKQDSSKVYRGWGQIVQTSEDNETMLTFPLNEPRTYSISNSANSDLPLPSNIQSKVFVHVGTNGQIEIENAFPSTSTDKVLLNESELEPKSKAAVVDKMTIKIGAISYVYRRIETPGSSQLKNLFGSLQCAVCLKFLENPQSLSCQHVFCQRCIKGLASDNANRASGIGRGQPAETNEKNALSCPVCRKSLAVSETKSARPQNILFDVTKQFKEILDGRPMCAMCSNQRWIMHGSDYFYCETCQNVLCPLCALDLHREHKLRSMLDTMLKSSREFIDKSEPTMQYWAGITKQVEDNKSSIKKTIAWMDLFKENLKKMEQKMEDSIKPSNHAWDKVQALEQPRLGDKVEINRTEALENFVNQMKRTRQSIPTMTVALNARLEVINRARKEIEEDVFWSS